KKWPTFWCLALCQLIPIVGPIVAIGYFFRRFTRERHGHQSEDFNFNQFAEYLKFGLWPFLASLPVTVVGIIVVYIALILNVIGISLMAEGGNPIVGLILLLLGLLGSIVLGLVLIAPIAALTFRAGALQGFKAGYDFGFIKSFCKKVGISITLYIFLIILISMPILIIASFTFVLIYPLSGILTFAMFHLYFQHYDLYVERGGEALAFAPELLAEYQLAPPGPPASPAQ
ncbi:MAG: hypothetical protein AAF236_09140, partial [Verrucomicrobiota bacterium]